MATDTYDSPDQRYSYQSDLVDAMRANDFTCRTGRLRFRLAAEVRLLLGRLTGPSP